MLISSIFSQPLHGTYRCICCFDMCRFWGAPQWLSPQQIISSLLKNQFQQCSNDLCFPSSLLRKTHWLIEVTFPIPRSSSRHLSPVVILHQSRDQSRNPLAWLVVSPRGNKKTATQPRALGGKFGGFLKWWGSPPKILHFNRVFHYFHHPFWVFSPYLWKHPFEKSLV